MVDTALRADFEYYVEQTAAEAVRETARRYKPGTFLVQLCDADPDSIKQTFHSRVRFG